MKRLLLIGLLGLSIPKISETQNLIQGSIQVGSANNKVEVVFLPNYSTTSEFVNYLSISVAIPVSDTASPNPIIAGVGNFSGLSFTSAQGYVQADEKVYSWICVNPSSSNMSWSSGISFVGATITFGNTPSQVKLVDFSSSDGGGNGNSWFSLTTNQPPFDVTKYADIFYEVGGSGGSTKGTYANGDHYVKTSAGESGRMKPNNNTSTVTRPESILYWHIFPNPADEKLNIVFDIAKNTNIVLEVFDSNGRTVKQKKVNVMQGSNSVIFDVSDLASGVYMLKMISSLPGNTGAGKFFKK
jgi:hypothetical protein